LKKLSQLAHGKESEMWRRMRTSYLTDEERQSKHPNVVEKQQCSCHWQ
jgi:hypothetical protein